jgi:tetratricopeptide (TPR) repeat protein
MAKVWREDVVIPTYEVGAEEKNPIFLEKRVYQGSSGVVYPYPVIESIANEKTDHTWHAVWLENEYIKVMILPELGGRVQMAYDKVKGRHFVYYNHVVKPALVGLAGPWISGGIEFNWPQHHRPSTYLPVDCDISTEADGSVVVWCSEMERMFHQKSTVGFRLRPGCAYLEIHVRLYNRTELPQTFLWWANPAVEVNDAYQSVFPPDVNAVFDHGKRAVSSFPIATGTYYKMDYSAGVDISNYLNIKVPTSYMGVNSQYDFEGGYENDTQAGMLHVANHHVSPGKKQWTWGNGDFGRAWDRNLTDATESGFRPYIELMAGVYTENQPDFSWMMPYEEKEFTQYFMPYRELGVVKQASKDLILNIEKATPSPSLGRGDEGGKVRIKVLATSRQEVRVELKADNGTILYIKECTLSPEEVFVEEASTQGTPFDALTLTVYQKGRYVRPLSWHAEPDEVRPIPDAAEAALPAADCKTVEQLYLTGLHLEQYRHATWSPLDYYEEALRRDPLDVRCNNQLGLWYLRRGRFEKAEPYLRTAVKVLMKRNPNPYWGEPLYNLGLCLKYQGLGLSEASLQGEYAHSYTTQSQYFNNFSLNYKLNEAYDWFYKATWNGGWQGAAYFACAQISSIQGRWEDALYEVERSLVAGYHNQKARALKAAILREMGRTAELPQLIAESLEQDRFNYGILYERYLLTKEEQVMDQIKELMHGNPLNYHELALDYAQAGLRECAVDVLDLAIQEGAVNAMTFFYKTWLGGEVCPLPAAPLPICFPNRLEDILALEAVMLLDKADAQAPYLLGCLYYDKRQYDEAMRLWERSAEINPQFPTVWRNLALATFNKVETLKIETWKGAERKNGRGEASAEMAVELMERAFHLDESDARVLMELDQLYKTVQRPHAERLAFLQQYPDLIRQRDDLVLEEITLLNQVGRYEEAMQKLDRHQFHPWEGGEGKVPAQYQICRVELAKKEMKNEKCNIPSSSEGIVDFSFGGEADIFHSSFQNAIRLLTECLEYPHHLGEGKLYGAQENDFYFLLGLAHEACGEPEEARKCWELATVGPTEPAAAMYYNDAKPDKIFYAALAYRRLGEDGKANGLCYKLINYGQQHLFDQVRMDYFAVSLPDLLIWDGDLQAKNTIHCNLMMALGHYGLGNREKGARFLKVVEQMDINHPVPSALRSLLTLLDSLTAADA